MGQLVTEEERDGILETLLGTRHDFVEAFAQGLLDPRARPTIHANMAGSFAYPEKTPYNRADSIPLELPHLLHRVRHPGRHRQDRVDHGPQRQQGRTSQACAASEPDRR